MSGMYARKRSKGLLLLFLPLLFSFLWVGGTARIAHANDNGLGKTPWMGWSTWSTFRGAFNEQTIKTQADAMAQKLKAHGYTYVNIDGGWNLPNMQSVDAYGRWAVDLVKFPDGIAGTAAYVHSLGLKIGLYYQPGVPTAAYNLNSPIEGTNYHVRDILSGATQNFVGDVFYVIDYNKPGAQEYINSWANLFASWGVDYLKFDFVTDSNIPDVRALSQALKQSGRQIWLDLSYALDYGQASAWRQYANSWRIDTDVECYCSTLVTWNSVSDRFQDAPAWAGGWTGPGGWPSLDSLDVGNASDGLTDVERQSVATLWAISASSLSSGDDLSKLDTLGLNLLTNDEVIAVDQAGIQATPVSTSSAQQVWRSYQADGSYIVALFNLDSTSANVTANWSDLGFSGSASVRDLWSHTDLGTATNQFSATLNPHASRLLRVTPSTPAPIVSYEAEASTNTLAGSAGAASCSACSGGLKVGYVGGNNGTLQFNALTDVAGYYTLKIGYLSGEDRSAFMSVNGGAGSLINFANTGGWNTLGTLSMSVYLQSGGNTLKFYTTSVNSWAPDFDRISLNATASSPFSYEAESPANTLAGGAVVAGCSACSGGLKVGNVGNGASIRFNNIIVASAQNYTITISYIDGDAGRSAQVSVNGAAPTTVTFPGTNDNNWNNVQTITMNVSLHAGINTLTILSPSGWAPDFDRIVL